MAYSVAGHGISAWHDLEPVIMTAAPAGLPAAAWHHCSHLLLCASNAASVLNVSGPSAAHLPQGFTPLHRAAYLAHHDGYLEIYEYLLVGGALLGFPAPDREGMSNRLAASPASCRCMQPPASCLLATVACLRFKLAGPPSPLHAVARR